MRYGFLRYHGALTWDGCLVHHGSLSCVGFLELNGSLIYLGFLYLWPAYAPWVSSNVARYDLLVFIHWCGSLLEFGVLLHLGPLSTDGFPDLHGSQSKHGFHAFPGSLTQNGFLCCDGSLSIMGFCSLRAR